LQFHSGRVLKVDIPDSSGEAPDERATTIEVGEQTDFVAFANELMEEPTVFNDRVQAIVVIQNGQLTRDVR
jgi:hypothetical protein